MPEVNVKTIGVCLPIPLLKEVNAEAKTLPGERKRSAFVSDVLHEKMVELGRMESPDGRGSAKVALLANVTNAAKKMPKLAEADAAAWLAKQPEIGAALFAFAIERGLIRYGTDRKWQGAGR